MVVSKAANRGAMCLILLAFVVVLRLQFVSQRVSTLRVDHITDKWGMS